MSSCEKQIFFRGLLKGTAILTGGKGNKIIFTRVSLPMTRMKTDAPIGCGGRQPAYPLPLPAHCSLTYPVTEDRVGVRPRGL